MTYATQINSNYMQPFAARVRVKAFGNQEFPTQLSVEQTARLVGVSRGRIMNLMDAGKIVGHRVTKTRYAIDALSIFEHLGISAVVVGGALAGNDD
jgi:hypothetical protein